VTKPARTIADLRRIAGRPLETGGISHRDLRRAVRQAAALGLEIGDGAHRDPTRSELERRFLLLCRRIRLPMPAVNVRAGGFEVDFLWPERRLVVETDGYRYHRGRAAFEDDRERDLALRALGYEVIRLSARQLERPGPVAELLKSRLARREGPRVRGD